MELAGFTEEECRLGLPYLEAVDDPESVLDVLIGFGMPVYAIGRTVGVLKDLQTATGKPRGLIAQALLEVGPYAAQLGLDIESVATSIRVLFQAGSDRPGIVNGEELADPIAVHWMIAPRMPYFQPRQPAPAREWAVYWQRVAAALQDTVLRERDRGTLWAGSWFPLRAARAYKLARRWMGRASAEAKAVAIVGRS